MWVGIFWLAAVFIDRCGCDRPRMPVAGSLPLRQPMDGGSMKTAACEGMLVASLDACQALMCNSVGGALCLMQEQVVASHGGRC